MKPGYALLLLGAMHARAQTGELVLEAGLSRAIVNKVYAQPTPEQLSRARGLFLLTLRAECALAELRTNWSLLGFELTEVRCSEGTLWLVSEPAGREGGRGWYLFRPGDSSAIALETPHARNDIHTGLLGLRLFLQGHVRACAASTITRYTADMAHLDDTFFQAFTLAFAQACPTGLVAQLHGFESANHASRGRTGDVIASAGTRSPQKWLAEMVDKLKDTTSLLVLAYPRDTRQLGALFNAQAQGLQTSRDCRFLHLEMSLEVRKRLENEKPLRALLLDSLSASPRK